MFEVAESVLEEIEREHSKGITSAALLNFFADKGIRFGEATLRKWVQLGLLPRSVRVGRKGKHQGSKGQYPVRVVRQIIRIKRLMADGMTIEDRMAPQRTAPDKINLTNIKLFFFQRQSPGGTVLPPRSLYIMNY